MINIELIEFADQTITIEYDSQINAIAGTYKQLLGRQADADGLVPFS